MPLTLSHPAVVLPLRRLGLPMTGLVAGSMIPDLPLFLGSPRGYEATHSTPGIVTMDVVLTAAVVVAWFLLVRDALVDLAPDAVRSRLPSRARLTTREWVLTPVAAAVGAATHVFWDSFTHPGRWGVRRVDWLQTEHAGTAGDQWAQLGSGGVGLVVVTVAAVLHLRASRPVDPGRPPRALPAATLPTVVGLGALAGVVSAARSIPDGLHVMAFDGVVNSLTVLALGLVAGALAWNIVRRRAAE